MLDPVVVGLGRVVGVADRLGAAVADVAAATGLRSAAACGDAERAAEGLAAPVALAATDGVELAEAAPDAVAETESDGSPRTAACICPERPLHAAASRTASSAVAAGARFTRPADR